MFFKFDRAVQRKGAYILFLLRGSFLVPHNMLTYACAVTDMSYWQFCVGNLAVVPVSFVWTYYGATAASLQLSIQHKGF